MKSNVWGQGFAFIKACPLAVILLLAPWLVHAQTATPGGVQLRPVDQATVRIVAISGAEVETALGNHSGRVWSLVRPNIGHGSGVVIDGRGLILTAAHVVQDADVIAIVHPGETTAHPARLIHIDGTCDVAFIGIETEVNHVVPLPERSLSLQTSQRISTSGYPMELRERYPAAASGEIARALNDGRLQLSMSLNPGNSGGPVIDDEGRLVGVISQRGDPSMGVLGVALAEPLTSVIDAYQWASLAFESHLGRPFTPGDVAAAELISFMLDSETTDDSFFYDALNRWEQLAELDPAPSPGVSAFISAMTYAGWAVALESYGALNTNDVPDDVRPTMERLRALSRRLAERALSSDPTVASRYPELQFLANTQAPNNWSSIQNPSYSCGVEGSACCNGRCYRPLLCVNGVCQQPTPCDDSSACAEGSRCFRGTCQEQARRKWFTLGIGVNMLTDDDERSVPVSGGGANLHGYLHIYEIGGRTPFRLSFLGGVDLLLGGWRSNLAFSFTADIGMRLALGNPRMSVALTALYGLGVSVAESRRDFIFASYRVGVGLLYRIFGLGFTYRESARNANSPLRSVGFYTEWGF